MTETEFKHRYLYGYALADVLAVVALVLFVMFLITKKGFLAFGVTLAAAAVSIPVQTAFGKARVFNNSSSTIEVKEENGSDIIKVLPGCVSPAIDGVRVGNAVYKLPDGVHATVDAEGNLKAHSITGKFMLAIAGGRLAKAPDQYWQPLFEA